MGRLLTIIAILRSMASQNINFQITCSHLRNAISCLEVERKFNDTNDVCPQQFHRYYCSPETLFGEVREVKCPFYLLQLYAPEVPMEYAGNYSSSEDYGSYVDSQYSSYYNSDTVDKDNRWPTHYFRGFDQISDEFAELRTTQLCNITKGGWETFNLTICKEIRDKYNEKYRDLLGCHNPDCSAQVFDSNGNERKSMKDKKKAFEVRMLQYTRMILISGFAVSLVATFLGTVLMLILRRLRCTRIWIHINLQVSFMLRAGVWLLHDVYSRADTTLTADPDFHLTPKMERFFEKENITMSDYAYGQTNNTFQAVISYLTRVHLDPSYIYRAENHTTHLEVYNVFCEDDSNWLACRTYDIIAHYVLCTNYFWILVEGIYLWMLLQGASFGFSMGNMSAFLFVGWGMAFIPTITWAVVNYFVRNDVSCWANDVDLTKSTLNSFGKTYKYELITEIPIMITVLINVFIFISVVSIVGSKLRVNVMRTADFRYRLARSTMALIPLLGIHYVTTMFIKVSADESRVMLHVIANFTNAVLTSIQGLLVSIIYCFCNAEVQDELEKTYSAWKLGRDVRDDANRRRSTLSNSQSGGTWWPGQRRRSSMFLGGRSSFSFGYPVRRSTEQTYIPSESLISAGRSASIAGPTVSVSTSTMRKIKQMFNKDDTRINSVNHIPPRIFINQNSLLNVPSSYEDEIISPPPPYSGPSCRKQGTMGGIQEEKSDKDGEKRREGVVTRPTSNETFPDANVQPTENNDSGFDEKD